MWWNYYPIMMYPDLQNRIHGSTFKDWERGKWLMMYAYTLAYTYTQANPYTHIYTCTNVVHIHTQTYIGTRVSKQWTSTNKHKCLQYIQQIMYTHCCTHTHIHSHVRLTYMFYIRSRARKHTYIRQQWCHYAIYTYVYTGAKDVNYAATAPGSAQLTRQYWIKLDNWLVEDMARPPDMRVKLRVAS